MWIGGRRQVIGRQQCPLDPPVHFFNFASKYRDKRKQEARITNGVGSENQEINQAASVACVLEDEETHEPVAVNDADTLLLYNFKQKETVKDVIINPELNTEQQADIREILNEYQDIFSDVSK